MNLRRSTKYRLSIFVAMIMLLQMLAPIGGDLAWADEVDFEVVDEQAVENSDGAQDGDSEGDTTEAGAEVPKDPDFKDTDEVDETDQTDDTNETDQKPGDPESEGKVIGEEDNKKDEKVAMLSKMQTLGAAKDLGNIFTDVKVMLNDVEVADGSAIEVTDGMNLRLEYQWQLADDVDLVAGDWSQITLPAEFQLQRDESGDLLDSEEVKIGTYQLTKASRELKVIFNDKLIDKTGRSGEVWAQFDFNLSEFEDNTIQNVEFGTNPEKDFTIKLKPKGGALIDKTGLADASLNASSITWTIDVNTSLNDITDARISDTIPDGLSLENIEIYNLDVGYEGKLTTGSKVRDETEFPIVLGDINSAYRLIFKTKIEDIDKGPFTNEAIITGGNIAETRDDASVETPVGSLIKKLDGKADNDTNAKNIKWKIQVNAAKGTINNAKVKDIIEENLILLEGSDEEGRSLIKLYNLDVSPEGTVTRGSRVEDSDFTYDYDETSKELIINLGDIDSAYEIEYVTDIKYGTNKDDYGKSYDFSNTAKLTGADDEELGESTGNATVKRAAIFSKDGKKNIKPDSKKIDWTIKVNETKDSLGDVWVEDKSGPGIEYIPGTLVVKDKDGNTVPEDSYTLKIPGDGGYDFKLMLGDITSSYTVTYSTKITDFNIKDFTNAARISWLPQGDGTGTGGGTVDRVYIEIDKGVNAPVDHQFSKAAFGGTKHGKAFSKLDYENKIMSWQISAGAYKGKLKDLRIVDTFPNNGLVFLPNTLVVEHNGTLLELGTDYTVSPNGDNYGEGFIIELVGNIPKISTFADSSYEDSVINIYYSTSFDTKYENMIQNTTNNTYKNKAVITGSSEYGGATTPINKTVEANQKINDTAYKNGKKIGKINRDAREITWGIYVNYMSKNLKANDFVITDELTEGQVLDMDSFEVKSYTLSKDGKFENIIIGETLDKGSYAVEKTDKGFTLTFPGGIDTPYFIEYKTNIEGISKAEYKNTATVTGGDEYTDKVTYPNHNDFLFKEATNVEGERVWIDDEIDWEIEINKSLSDINAGATIVDDIGEGLVFKKASVKIYKSDGITLLDSDKYTVIDVRNEPEGTGTTLTITFNENIKEKYIVKYTTVVVTKTGPLTNNAAFNGTKVEGNISGGVTVEVGQSSGGTGGGRDKKGAISISKLDSENNIISAEAEFEVYYMLNDQEQLVGNKTYKTQNGKIEIDNLTFRTYYIKEISVPNGFEIDEEEPIEVVVNREAGSTNEGVYNIEITNTNITIDVTGTKVWVDGPAEKPTIKLQLYRNGQPKDEPVELVNGIVTHTWTDLAKTDNAGVDYVYTVNEVETPENFAKNEEGLIVTNTYVIPKTEVTGKKVWIGGSSKKPTIQLQLYKNGEEFGEPVELQDGTTEYTWIDLDQTDKNAIAHVYTVDEVEIPRRYRKTVSEDGLTITNRYRPSRPIDPDPVDPEDPDPTDPTDPVKPEDPDPEDPIDPEDPDPTDPTDPTDPHDPVKPTDPEEPTKPGEDPDDEAEANGETPVVLQMYLLMELLEEKIQMVRMVLVEKNYPRQVKTAK